ncbi:ATP synthase subunit I [Coxiella endosymbiont of Dermacentor marginatus]|uniref:ATP synthase subunit I n=1 Tax=Coxiella endosymbiont of Dermacentor marginatus TaxID=1656159 RepID=UPI002222F331|nr:ATP synthase subunit I [Coxiella endosymbiont of Dermacentor marginatus]
MLLLLLKIYILGRSNRFSVTEVFVHQKSPSDKAAQSIRLIAYRLVGLQAIVIVIVAFWWWIKGPGEGLSVLLGGMACLLPSLYFARRLFDTTSLQAVKQLMVNFYIGELIKLILSAGLVIIIILYVPVSIVSFIIGFVGAQFGFWLAPLVI